ncbi:MAG: TrkA family potassium uptake protein [Clostridiales bacterium]|nr:TrkA family potassium uptake protein [Clostridiales bacterium]
MKNILVIGAGRFGTYLMQKLQAQGDEILCIDNQEERLQKVLPYVTSSLIGDATDPDFMKSVGVEAFDLCVVSIGDDFQSSLEATSLLKELGAKFVISRASRGVHEKFLLRNGADEVVYPEKFMAKWAAIRFSSSTVKDYIPVPGDYSIFEVEVPSSWVGKSMIDLKIRQNMRLNVLAVKNTKDDFNMDYDPSEPFKQGQTVVIIGSDSDLKKYLGLTY